jgi:hypothetical protein
LLDFLELIESTMPTIDASTGAISTGNGITASDAVM